MFWVIDETYVLEVNRRNDSWIHSRFCRLQSMISLLVFMLYREQQKSKASAQLPRDCSLSTFFKKSL
ncbi:hypothetical protein Hanom_Chr08g00743541 [Helianthus anomalus]